MRHHLTPVTTVIINNSANNKSPRGCGGRGTLVHCGWECRLELPLWKAVWWFLKKLKMELPCDTAIPLQGTYPKKPKTQIQKNTCTPMFIAMLFTIAEQWRQPCCPSIDEWMKSCGAPVQWNVAWP